VSPIAVATRRARRPTRSADDFIPARPTLARLRAAAHDCRGCGLYKLGTQTVFGEGPKGAKLFVIGEQPGDAEDRAGRPFVGPSGALLDRAFAAAGIDRDEVYVTNAVKHFKWARDQKSKRRLHRTPSATEIRACFPWLSAELSIVRPQAILCLGATAAKTLFGRAFSVAKHRAMPVESEWAPLAFATVHPSAILRAPDNERARAERLFFGDIQRIAHHLEASARQR
jgi:uracil-DNA glycosylase